MIDRKYHCVHCGEYFTPNKDDKELIEEGWIMPSDTCNDCFDMITNLDMIDIGSDADPGL